MNRSCGNMSCGGALIHQLKAYGVDTVFGIPGVHTLEFYREMEAAGIRHIGVRHEQGSLDFCAAVSSRWVDLVKARLQQAA